METTFHRYKAILGSAMRARGLASQTLCLGTGGEGSGEQSDRCQGRNKIRPDGGGKPDHLAAGSCV